MGRYWVVASFAQTDFIPRQFFFCIKKTWNYQWLKAVLPFVTNTYIFHGWFLYHKQKKKKKGFQSSWGKKAEFQHLHQWLITIPPNQSWVKITSYKISILMWGIIFLPQSKPFTQKWQESTMQTANEWKSSCWNSGALLHTLLRVNRMLLWGAFSSKYRFIAECSLQNCGVSGISLK